MRPTLHEYAGGEQAFLRLAEAHHARCVADPELNHPFSHDDLDPEHMSRLAAYWAEVMGGPPRFSQECADQSALLRMHADDAGLPADAEFRATLRAYMEWAVDDVLARSPRDAVVPADLPIPRWSWNGLQTTPA